MSWTTSCVRLAKMLQNRTWHGKALDIPRCLGSMKRMPSSQDRDTDNKTSVAASAQDDNTPVALRFFTDEIQEQIDCVRENKNNAFEKLDQNLDNIKFDIENLQALKIKHQLLKKAITESENVTDPETATKRVLIGTADATHPKSSVPCGGCGAVLHCNDPAIPGYIPQELFKGQKTENLGELYCRRCTLLNVSPEVIQTEIDKSTYKQIIKKIKEEFALIVMVVDVTDMANSIIPDFLEGIGTQKPIFIVGNKVDLIPKDAKGHMENILFRLEDECRRALLNPSGNDIQYSCLVSAKTGYGIEKLINKLIKVWDVKGNIYLVGTTNSGKSTLFNKFLESDYCKHSCRDIVQRATVSRWPGTTLDLIKFPIIKASKWRLYLRTMRLKADTIKQTEMMEKRKARLKTGTSKHAVIYGTVGKTDFRNEATMEEENRRFDPTGSHFPTYNFDIVDNNIDHDRSYGKESVLEKRRTVLEEMYPDSKWACDTPGLINENQLINYLNGDELRMLCKLYIIHPRVFVMKPGDVMFITGLARIDYLEGCPKTYLTVHTNPLLPVHVVFDCNADKFYEENVGTEQLGLPLGDSNRLNKMSSLCGREYTFSTEDKRTASVDLQLSSLGWVSFAAQPTEIRIRAYTPGGRGMHLREPALLLNFTAFKGQRIYGRKEFRMRKLKL